MDTEAFLEQAGRAVQNALSTLCEDPENMKGAIEWAQEARGILKTAILKMGSVEPDEERSGGGLRGA